MNHSSDITATAAEHRHARKVAIASMIGTTIEYYDFFLYGTAAALVFSSQFFPELSPAIGLLASFAAFAVGFIARPIGGLVFGHFGDRIGRKKLLVITLIIMGSASALIGVLPTYETIGIWAPILLVLLRLLQGIGLGAKPEAPYSCPWSMRRRAARTVSRVSRKWAHRRVCSWPMPCF